MLFNELDKVKNSNKEMKLYMSVIAKMIVAGNPRTLDNLEKDSDKKLATILTEI
jgi:hypothetical protein